ncbi:Uncharacterised protein [Mycobacteroides abscessus subsp. abscessus]|nr:Uncharacterised protein [Mycobacteroides abscessus subsp. abscessus]
MASELIAALADAATHVKLGESRLDAWQTNPRVTMDPVGAIQSGSALWSKSNSTALQFRCHTICNCGLADCGALR